MKDIFNSKPLVSVIMPVYNCEDYVDEAIRSIVNQTYSNLEIIVVDDCSEDDTLVKIEQWAIRDSRIKVIKKQVNTGQTESLNIAMLKANGVFFARMDGDDISRENRITAQVQFLIRNPEIGLVSCDYSILNSQYNINLLKDNDELKVGLLFYNQFVSSGSMWRSAVSKINGIVFSAHRGIEDYDFFVRLSMVSKVGNLNQPLVFYRLHEKNITKKFEKIRFPHALEIFNNQIRELGIENSNNLLIQLEESINSDVFLEEINLLMKICKRNISKNLYNQKILFRNILYVIAFKINKIGRKRAFYLLFFSCPWLCWLVFIPYNRNNKIRPSIELVK
jgi:glycosyltransferase involved in cell wall biosynthesis